MTSMGHTGQFGGGGAGTVGRSRTPSLGQGDDVFSWLLAEGDKTNFSALHADSGMDICPQSPTLGAANGGNALNGLCPSSSASSPTSALLLDSLSANAGASHHHVRGGLGFLTFEEEFAYGNKVHQGSFAEPGPAAGQGPGPRGEAVVSAEARASADKANLGGGASRKRVSPSPPTEAYESFASAARASKGMAVVHVSNSKKRGRQSTGRSSSRSNGRKKQSVGGTDDRREGLVSRNHHPRMTREALVRLEDGEGSAEDDEEDGEAIRQRDVQGSRRSSTGARPSLVSPSAAAPTTLSSSSTTTSSSTTSPSSASPLAAGGGGASAERVRERDDRTTNKKSSNNNSSNSNSSTGGENLAMLRVAPAPVSTVTAGLAGALTGVPLMHPHYPMAGFPPHPHSHTFLPHAAPPHTHMFGLPAPGLAASAHNTFGLSMGGMGSMGAAMHSTHAGPVATMGIQRPRVAARHSFGGGFNPHAMTGTFVDPSANTSMVAPSSFSSSSSSSLSSCSSLSSSSSPSSSSTTTTTTTTFSTSSSLSLVTSASSPDVRSFSTRDTAQELGEELESRTTSALAAETRPRTRFDKEKVSNATDSERASCLRSSSPPSSSSAVGGATSNTSSSSLVAGKGEVTSANTNISDTSSSDTLGVSGDGTLCSSGTMPSHPSGSYTKAADMWSSSSSSDPSVRGCGLATPVTSPASPSSSSSSSSASSPSSSSSFSSNSALLSSSSSSSSSSSAPSSSSSLSPSSSSSLSSSTLLSSSSSKLPSSSSSSSSSPSNLSFSSSSTSFTAASPSSSSSSSSNLASSVPFAPAPPPAPAFLGFPAAHLLQPHPTLPHTHSHPHPHTHGHTPAHTHALPPPVPHHVRLRLEKNRESAQKCRRKRKEMLEDLQTRLQELEKENADLRIKLQIQKKQKGKNEVERSRKVKELKEMLERARELDRLDREDGRRRRRSSSANVGGGNNNGAQADEEGEDKATEGSSAFPSSSTSSSSSTGVSPLGTVSPSVSSPSSSSNSSAAALRSRERERERKSLLREIEAFISAYTDRYADYGKDRRAAIHYHMEHLQRLLMPTPVTKMTIWTLMQEDEFYDAGGGSQRGKSRARASARAGDGDGRKDKDNEGEGEEEQEEEEEEEEVGEEEGRKEHQSQQQLQLPQQERSNKAMRVKAQGTNKESEGEEDRGRADGQRSRQSESDGSGATRSASNGGEDKKDIDCSSSAIKGDHDSSLQSTKGFEVNVKRETPNAYATQSSNDAMAVPTTWTTEAKTTTPPTTSSSKPYKHFGKGTQNLDDDDEEEDEEEEEEDEDETSPSIWSILCKTLDVTSQQKERVMKMREEYRGVCEKMAESMQKANELKKVIDEKNNLLKERMEAVEEVLTIEQKAKFITWVTDNRACIHMLNKLWKL